jgi:hypothetical protein
MSVLPKVLVAIPAFHGNVHYTTVQSVLLMVATLGRKLNLSVSFVANESLITRARNHLVAQALDGGFTHLFFLDADIGFSPEALFNLVMSDHEISCIAYPMKRTYYPRIQQLCKLQPDMTPEELEKKATGFVFNPLMKDDGKPDLSVDAKGFMEVSAGATGFMCIQVSALQKMMEAYPQLKYDNDIEDYKKFDTFTYNFFDTLLVNKRYLSEDYAFSKLWRDLGGKIYMQTRFELSHTGPISFSSSIACQLKSH